MGKEKQGRKGPGHDGLRSLDLFLRHLGATEGFQAEMCFRKIVLIAVWRMKWSWARLELGRLVRADCGNCK